MNEGGDTAVQVDLVWTTTTDHVELANTKADKWFLGEEALCRSSTYAARTVTTGVTVKDAEDRPEILLGGGELTPPAGLDIEGFVVFALYKSIKKKGALLRCAHPDPSNPGGKRACKFAVTLGNDSISMSPQE